MANTDVTECVKQSSPLLSIIIPCLNEEQTIVNSLSTLQSLRNKQCELIVVDGGSRDRTLSLATSLADKCISSSPGRAEQMNQGAAVAKGDWLLFLHVDTLLPQNVTQTFLQLNEAKKNWGFFSLRLSGANFLFRIIEHAISLRSRITGIATGDQALFVRRYLFFQVKGYADIPLMEDVEFCSRLRRQSSPVVISEIVMTSSRRWEKNGIINTVLLMWCLRLAYFFGVSPKKLHKIYYQN